MPLLSLLTLALAHTANSYVVRDAGSYVVGQTRDKADTAGGQDIKDFLAELDWREVTSGVRADGMGFAACRYFVATLPENVEAYEAIAEWNSLSPEQQDRVIVRRSPHQSGKTGHLNELISGDIAPLRSHEVVMAVGNKDDPAGDPELAPSVYFWAPGRFTKFTIISDEMAADKRLIPPHATVKLEGAV